MRLQSDGLLGLSDIIDFALEKLNANSAQLRQRFAHTVLANWLAVLKGGSKISDDLTTNDLLILLNIVFMKYLILKYWHVDRKAVFLPFFFIN